MIFTDFFLGGGPWGPGPSQSVRQNRTVMPKCGQTKYSDAGWGKCISGQPGEGWVPRTTPVGRLNSETSRTGTLHSEKSTSSCSELQGAVTLALSRQQSSVGRPHATFLCSDLADAAAALLALDVTSLLPVPLPCSIGLINPICSPSAGSCDHKQVLVEP